MGRGGRGVVYVVCRINVLVFSNFNIQKGVEVIIGLKLKIRIMSSVTMFNTILFTKGGLVIFNKSCLTCLKLSALFSF